MLTDELRLSGVGLEAVLQTIRRETWVQCLMETGPDPRKAKYPLSEERIAAINARAKARFELEAAEKFPMPSSGESVGERTQGEAAA